MKHYSLISLMAILIVLSTACQPKPEEPTRLDNYRPMLVDGYQWNVLHQSPYAGEGYPIVYQTSIWQIQGDSSINGTTYKKVMLCFSEDKTAWQLGALLREDVDEQRIYLLQNEKEHLLYDFGMKVGDQTKLYLNEYYGQYPADYYLQLREINTTYDNKREVYREFVYDVYFKDGEDYKPWCTHTTWERFGSPSGLICQNVSMIDGAGSYQLLCAHDDANTVVWFNKYINAPYAGSCFFVQ